MGGKIYGNLVEKIKNIFAVFFDNLGGKIYGFRELNGPKGGKIYGNLVERK
jgi:hypothetical protein